MVLTQKKGQYIPPNSDVMQEKFICMMMWEGKKSVSRKIFDDAMKILKDKKENSLEIFNKALSNVTPTIEVRPKRIGGAVYQVPIEVPQKRQMSLCMRWIIKEIRKKKGSPVSQRLARELLDAANQQGGAYKKREDVHRMAQANKAFAHLAKY